ncbi:hypothetical protein M3F63_07100 [Brachybacterium muris]|uniref:hypothetical protein n=1 Tax=Brachybacterium muris TaxID=219301 RepID=UPI00223AFD76|nr:hypothetical protein [Brachybacterium muris]MCT2177435.1 hypothetical protein [Brachybacterium muris]
MPTRADTIRRLAETDPYWRGYVDGLTDKRNIQPPETLGAYSCQPCKDARRASVTPDLIRTILDRAKENR